MNKQRLSIVERPVLRSMLCFIFLCVALSAGAKAPYRIHRLSEPELLQTYTNLLWDAVHHADQFWHDWPEHPGGGLWGSGRSDQMNEGIRAISEMVFTSGVLAKYSAKAGSMERKDLVRKASAAIRYVVSSHRSGPEKCTDGKPWGGSWQSAMWTGTMAFGAWLMWEDLDPDLRKDVERVVTSESDRFLAGRPPGGSFNDTKVEENGWNLICLSIAASMFPDHPHASAWQEKAIEYMINTLSAPQDQDDQERVEGRAISEWFSGANVHPDFTLENHGFFHPSYVACSSYFLTQTAMHYTYARRPIPRAATHHLLDTWHMFQGVILPCGEAAYPQGMDWELHGLSFINLFASLASYQKDPFAARMESMQLQYMRAWQEMCKGDLAVPGSKLGFTRHAICAEQASYGFLAHKLFGAPAKELTAYEATRLTEGVRLHDYAQFITHRTEKKFVSLSWTNRVMGMVIPVGPGHEDNPDFTVPIQNGVVGSFELSPRGDTKTTVREHRWKKTSAGFETTGTLLLNGGRLEQKLRLMSVGEQTVVYEDHVTALEDVTVTEERGMPLGIENDQITGDSRSLTCEGAETRFDTGHPRTPLTVPGNWANVDGRLGLVAVSGAGMTYAQAKGYSPGISVCADILYGSFSNRTKTFNKGEEIAHRTAVFYLEVSPRKTASLAKTVTVVQAKDGKVLRFRLPEGETATIPL
jgi:hypothetical protein